MGNFLSYPETIKTLSVGGSKKAKKTTKPQSKKSKTTKKGGSMNSLPEEEKYKQILLKEIKKNNSNNNNSNNIKKNSILLSTTPLFYNYISLKNNNSSKKIQQLNENPLLNLEGKTFVSIKGWGSGLTETNKDAFDFDSDIEKIELPEKFFIYWDGDNLKDDNYGVYIIKVCEKYKNRIEGIYCIKSKKSTDTINIEEFIKKLGLDKIVDMKIPITIGIIPLEDNPLNKSSKFGIYGALLNNVFKPVTTLYFGGGDVIDDEYNHDWFIKKDSTYYLFNIDRTREVRDNNTGEKKPEIQKPSYKSIIKNKSAIEIE